MKIGIVGNRTGFTYEYVRNILISEGITSKDEIISGGAKGVDTFAILYAQEIHAKYTIYYPDFNFPIPECFFHRNRLIVDASDVIIAFNNHERSGTTYTINYAKKVGKKVKVFPSGAITPGKDKDWSLLL